ncbi:F-actin capping protein alpha subunit-domain-containing protein [Phaeosphaeriaceae sp. PMI808]|nr:F-actin capping protein alpha subunit-domain-containing protein [Phaeosphaeriaceae sp. PMI808]
MIMHSPNVNMHHGGWGNGDRTGASSSVGSINMLGSDDSSSSSDEIDPMDPDDNDDPMIGTPQAKISIAFPGGASGPGGWAMNLFSPGANGLPNFMSIQRARLRKGRSRKSSSSASGHSSMASPGPGSPPNGNSSSNSKSEGYFAREAALRKAGSRRESLSLFANDLHISSGNDSGDEAAALPQTPGVVRRPVTRRGNLLPKSRQFGRIKAELFEESAPVDSEFRREAEIIRQVREADEAAPSLTAQSSPSLLPAVPGLDGPLEGVPEEESENGMNLDGSTVKGLFGAFGSLHSNHRSSVGGDFWNQRVAQTPPPPSFPRAESSAVSEDMSIDSPIVSSSHSTSAFDQNNMMGHVSRASTPGPMYPPTAADGLKKSNKRRRDDDFDETSIKRRAVSPGVSVHNSPIVSQSPAQRDGGLWGNAARNGRDASISGHSNGERSNSGGSLSMTPTLGPKRVGLLGMENANDGFMKMSVLDYVDGITYSQLTIVVNFPEKDSTTEQILFEMASDKALASFIEGAPPGELADVTKAIKSIIEDDSIEAKLAPAFQQYNEEQFTTTKLPGGSTEVLVSEYNSLGDGRYYDAESQSSFDFDHATGKASAVQSHVQESRHNDLVKSLIKSLSTHASEHYPKSSSGIFPTSDDTSLAILTVANKYSPTNYWNGRWRSSYIYTPSSSSLAGTIQVDVHYYEDGNVRLLTKKDVSLSITSGASGADVIKQIAGVEKKYQEDLNKAFGQLSEGAFKALRRQLPITRQKIEWEKISGYRLGQDIGGGGRR